MSTVTVQPHQVLDQVQGHDLDQAELHVHVHHGPVHGEAQLRV